MLPLAVQIQGLHKVVSPVSLALLVSPRVDMFSHQGSQLQDASIGRWGCIAIDQLFKDVQATFLYYQFTILFCKKNQFICFELK